MPELNSFLTKYEQATHSHDFDNVAPLVAKNAVYWFSDGSRHDGINAVRKVFEKNFAKIQNATYSIKNIKWLSATNNLAVCIYDFYWVGEIAGKKVSGNGRGTNVVGKVDGQWQMLHEHLSKKT